MVAANCGGICAFSIHILITKVMANSAVATKPAPAKVEQVKPVGKSTKSTKKPQESYKPSGDIREVVSFKDYRKMVVRNANDTDSLQRITKTYRTRKEYMPVRTLVQTLKGDQFETVQTGVSLRKVENTPSVSVMEAHKAGQGFKGYIGKDHVRLFWQKTADKQPLETPIPWVSVNGDQAISWEEYTATK